MFDYKVDISSRLSFLLDLVSLWLGICDTYLEVCVIGYKCQVLWHGIGGNSIADFVFKLVNPS
jgi:hypothetical protein